MPLDARAHVLLILAAHHVLTRIRDDPESCLIGSLPNRLQKLLTEWLAAAGVANTCTDAMVLALLPFFQPSSLRRIECVSAELGVSLHVDVYCGRRHGTAAQQLPVLIFVHGGAWTLGSRRQYRAVGQRLAHEGFVAVIVGYPLWPQADATAQVASVRTVVAQTKLHAAQWGGDPRRVFLSGQSSGANVCAMALLSPLAEASTRLSCAGLVGMSGVYDCVAHAAFEARRSLSAFSPMPLACASLHAHSPTLLVEREGWTLGCDRVLLLHGERDRVVPASSSALFALALTRGGQPSVEYEVLPEDGHFSFLVSLSLGRRTEPLLGRLKHFCGLSEPRARL